MASAGLTDVGSDVLRDRYIVGLTYVEEILQLQKINQAGIVRQHLQRLLRRVELNRRLELFPEDGRVDVSDSEMGRHFMGRAWICFVPGPPPRRELDPYLADFLVERGPGGRGNGMLAGSHIVHDAW